MNRTRGSCVGSSEARPSIISAVVWEAGPSSPALWNGSGWLGVPPLRHRLCGPRLGTADAKPFQTRLCSSCIGLHPHGAISATPQCLQAGHSTTSTGPFALGSATALACAQQAKPCLLTLRLVKDRFCVPFAGCGPRRAGAFFVTPKPRKSWSEPASSKLFTHRPTFACQKLSSFGPDLAGLRSCPH